MDERYRIHQEPCGKNKNKKPITAPTITMKCHLQGSTNEAQGIWQRQTQVLGGFASAKTACMARCVRTCSFISWQSRESCLRRWQRPAPNLPADPKTSWLTRWANSKKNVPALYASSPVVHLRADRSFNTSPLIYNTTVLREREAVDFPCLLNCFTLLFKLHRHGGKQ